MSAGIASSPRTSGLTWSSNLGGRPFPQVTPKRREKGPCGRSGRKRSSIDAYEAKAKAERTWA